MLQRAKQLLSGLQDTTIFLTVMLWVCVTPLVLVLIVPLFGWEIGIVAVALTLLIALALCWGICVFPTNLAKVQPSNQPSQGSKFTQEANSNVDRSRMRKAH